MAEITGCARLPAGGITGWQAPFYSAGDGTSCFIHDATVRRGVAEATEDGVEQLDVTVRSADALLRLQLLKGAEVLRVLEELVRRPNHHRHTELFRRRHFARRAVQVRILADRLAVIGGIEHDGLLVPHRSITLLIKLSVYSTVLSKALISCALVQESSTPMHSG